MSKYTFLMSEVEDEVDDRSIVGWFIVGLLLNVMGLLLVSVRKPRVSAELLAAYGDEDDRYLFKETLI